MELRIVRGAVSSMLSQPSQPSFVRTPVSAIAADGVRALRCHHVSNLRVGESLRFTGGVWKWGTPCMPSKKCQFTRGNGVYHDSPGVTLGVPGEFCLENDAKPLDFEGFSVNLQTKPVFHGPFLGLSQVTLAYTAYAAAGRAWAMILEAFLLVSPGSEESWKIRARGEHCIILYNIV